LPPAGRGTQLGKLPGLAHRDGNTRKVTLYPSGTLAEPVRLKPNPHPWIILRAEIVRVGLWAVPIASYLGQYFVGFFNARKIQLGVDSLLQVYFRCFHITLLVEGQPKMVLKDWNLRSIGHRLLQEG
jgi:hypothetical protein